MRRGGWRWGAGRPGWRPKAEQCRRVDVRWLHRTGRLAGAGGIYYSIGDEPAGSISYSNTPDALLLSYTLNGEPRLQRVPKLRTGCNYGGWRTWLGCPHCGRRCAVLYLTGSGFYCRLCAQVAYQSQSEDAASRALGRLHRLEAKLGLNGERPKRTHRRTFERLIQQLEEADAASWAYGLARFGPDVLREVLGESDRVADGRPGPSSASSVDKVGVPD